MVSTAEWAITCEVIDCRWGKPRSYLGSGLLVDGSAHSQMPMRPRGEGQVHPLQMPIRAMFPEVTAQVKSWMSCTPEDRGKEESPVHRSEGGP